MKNERKKIKIIKIKNGRINREKCHYCNQLIPLPKRPKFSSPDVDKMKKIMKKNNFTQMSLAQTIGISQGTVAGWFTATRNLQGKIKKIYFDILKNKGFF